MRIDQLLRKLERLRAEHGDGDVYIAIPRMWPCVARVADARYDEGSDDPLVWRGIWIAGE